MHFITSFTKDNFPRWLDVYAIPFLHQMCHTVDIPGGDIGGFPGRTILCGLEIIQTFYRWNTQENINTPWKSWFHQRKSIEHQISSTWLVCGYANIIVSWVFLWFLSFYEIIIAGNKLCRLLGVKISLWDTASIDVGLIVRFTRERK